MFKYVKFEKVETELTVLEFRGSVEGVEVNHFDGNVVSMSSDVEAKMDELVAMQASEINCTIITQAEFKALVENSAQLNRVREIVKAKIAQRYDVADEVAMSKRSVDDVKKIAYEEYVRECLSVGYGLKASVGY